MWEQRLQINKQKNLTEQICESSIEDEALSIDLQINGLQTISSIPIENVGVYSYRGHLAEHSPLFIEKI